MKEFACRLDAYIRKHPFDPGKSDCETVLEQLYQAYAESHESDPAEIDNGFQELEDFLTGLPLKDKNACSTCAAACAVPMSAKPFWTACNTGRT